MTAAAADLQKAMFSALAGNAALLSALGGPKIFDNAPAHAAFPYVAFGRSSVYDWSTSTESGVEQLVTLHVWSKGRGRKETLDIMESVRAALDQAPLDLDAHHLVDLRLEYSEVRYDEDVGVHHGLLRLRAVTEATA